MKALVELVAKALVDRPEDVSVAEVDAEDEIIVELSVAESDLGKVIGKQGRTVRAMRTLVEAAGDKNGQRFYLDIIE